MCKIKFKDGFERILEDLRNADLREADLSDANLRNADLREADLRNADLRNANLRNADLREADLREADLSDANLREADLRNADLRNANLRNADLRNANLRNADLSDADLRNADLREADLSDANLRNADLSDADLRNADLREADLSRSRGLVSPIEYINDNFETTKEGIIAYKSFGENYSPNPDWKIEKGTILMETVNFDRTLTCACGVNVGTLDWSTKNCRKEIWKVLIKWEWLAGVCVPYNTDGKIRAERVQLIQLIKID